MEEELALSARVLDGTLEHPLQRTCEHLQPSGDLRVGKRNGLVGNEADATCLDSWPWDLRTAG